MLRREVCVFLLRLDTVSSLLGSEIRRQAASLLRAQKRRAGRSRSSHERTAQRHRAAANNGFRGKDRLSSRGAREHCGNANRNQQFTHNAPMSGFSSRRGLGRRRRAPLWLDNASQSCARVKNSTRNGDIHAKAFLSPILRKTSPRARLFGCESLQATAHGEDKFSPCLGQDAIAALFSSQGPRSPD
jgi:hypothetical protein